ncbi:P-loop containing nucleoside triphosphate hydrolase protein [Boeremia exigua]|uniref:P-loop containing nucleoside triphosphate hydrolase protein n=1 Tax=Boeremia exigua TaxID=749465 RepID=UPI001E8D2E02|nr:P-loop containing nucleoside triphosphate hydrolase protein [Boeremia exigua]KAH6614165.1 P-loop containing nucleoside triphosphate hydrolase protein [Boeremia exigua]
MPALPALRSPLCLRCAVAARPLPPQRLLARVQVAHRSTSTPKSQGKGKSNDTRSRNLVTNPLTVRRKAPPTPSTGRLHDSVQNALEKLRAEFSEPDYLHNLQLNREQFADEWKRFEAAIAAWVKQSGRELVDLVQQASRGKDTLQTRLRYLFYAQTCGGRFTKAELENQKQVADLRYPAEWYPATREVPRVVHMHVGPTNSGKTYHALQRLEAAKSGIYLGPLRLLAHEVYTRLNAKGRSCALVTGEEQRVPDGDAPPMYSCTVEMAPLNTKFDVAVIDEIQMISHPERGWAWTQAFLGLQAREIHLCGEARTVDIMRELCALVGDEVHVHEYERLTPLKVQSRSLYGKLQNLEKGDCVVAFTVVGIHALRREIESNTGRKCAIVYGSLPPETRAQQARLFNDPDNDYDYLVASDAIGMGLNLAIKRVVFESTWKSNGITHVPLEISEIKQIAGRAGRYKTAADAVNDADKTATDKPAKEEKTIGWCTTLDQLDLPALQAGMLSEPTPITTAGLFPPSLIVERFANYFPPGTPFSYILLRLHEISETHPRFRLCGLKEQLAIADALVSIKNLSIQDRIVITSAPCNVRDRAQLAFLHTLASCIATGSSGALLDLDTLPLAVMDAPPQGTREYLYSLEQLHKMLVLYLWLSYRFPNVFTTRPTAEYAKKLLEDQIESTLLEFSHTEIRRKQIAKREKARMERAEQRGRRSEGAGSAGGSEHPSASPDEPETNTQPATMPPPPGLPAEAAAILNDTTPFRDPAAAFPEQALDDVDANALGAVAEERGDGGRRAAL